MFSGWRSCRSCPSCVEACSHEECREGCVGDQDSVVGLDERPGREEFLLATWVWTVFRESGRCRGVGPVHRRAKSTPQQAEFFKNEMRAFFEKYHVAFDETVRFGIDGALCFGPSALCGVQVLYLGLRPRLLCCRGLRPLKTSCRDSTVPFFLAFRPRLFVAAVDLRGIDRKVARW